MLELQISDIRKRIGGLEILKGISLDLKAGEVVALLGHSGSGKTTLLRSVAGLEVPDSGTMLLGDKTMFDGARGINLPPEKRGLSLVFQSYALWPNRTVAENVGYGLKLRRVSSSETDTKVRGLLDRLGLGGLAERYPHQLSGGQQQRVALARALAYQPRVLLLDEPLSNLDAKLREDARSWLRELIVQTGISALYVTHDQVEAMAVADRILLLRGGAVEQEGTPVEIYQNPATFEAAQFMGSNNLLDVTVTSRDANHATVAIGDTTLNGTVRSDAAAGGKAKALIRIEQVRMADGASPGRVACELLSNLYLGERYEYVLSLGGQRLRAWGDQPREPGPTWIELAQDKVWIF